MPIEQKKLSGPRTSLGLYLFPSSLGYCESIVPYLQLQASNFLIAMKQEEEKRGSQLDLNPGHKICNPMVSNLFLCRVPGLI